MPNLHILYIVAHRFVPEVSDAIFAYSITPLLSDCLMQLSFSLVLTDFRFLRGHILSVYALIGESR